MHFDRHRIHGYETDGCDSAAQYVGFPRVRRRATPIALCTAAGRTVVRSHDQMSFTITRKLQQLPSYPTLCHLAEQNQVHVTGDDHIGSFSCRGVEGNYEFNEDGIHGKFAGHGVKGEFSIQIGKAAVTITDKPFWLPEMLLNAKITEGLDTLCNQLV